MEGWVIEDGVALVGAVTIWRGTRGVVNMVMRFWKRKDGVSGEGACMVRLTCEGNHGGRRGRRQGIAWRYTAVNIV